MDNSNTQRLEALTNWLSECNPNHEDVAKIMLDYVSGRCVYTIDKRWFCFNDKDKLWLEDTEGCFILQNIHFKLRPDIERVFEEGKRNYQEIKKKIDILSCSKTNIQSIIDEKQGLISQEQVVNVIIDRADHLLNKLGDVPFCKRILSILSFYLYDKDFLTNLDNQPHILAFTNGVWDFKENKFRETEPSDMVSKCIGFSYKEKIDPIAAKKIDDFMNKLYPLPEQRDYVIKMFSRQLYGDKCSPMFHVHSGFNIESDNGKELLFKLIKASLGDYAHQIDVNYLTEKKKHLQKINDFESWKGARILFCDVPSKVKKINSSILKEYIKKPGMTYVTSGSKVSSKFVPMFKIHLMCNKTPGITENDGLTQGMIGNIDYISHVDELRFVDGLNNRFIKTDLGMEFLRKLLSQFDYSFDFKGPTYLQ